MVARDGIEPPTPAFSGPRSTTELPGLSADFVANSCAGIDPGEPGRKGFPRTVRCNNFASISTPLGGAKRSHHVAAISSAARQSPQNRVNFRFRAGPETLHWKAI